MTIINTIVAINYHSLV